MTPLEPDPPTTLERGAGVAVWRQIAHALELELTAGRPAPGGRLPTEAELAARFAVNRHTIRRALAALAARGLVRIEQGRGTFVQDVVIDYPLRPRTSFGANLLAQGREPASEVLAVAEVVADPGVARALGLPPGSDVVRSTARGLADGIPIAHGLSHFPAERFAGLADRLRTAPSISVALAACGLADFRRRSTRILTRLPSVEEAACLRQSPMQPVLITEAVDVDLEGRPIRHGITAFAGARVQLTVAVDAAP